MIKSLEIKGLERHKKTKLEFHDKINVIIGSSNTGKSSIVKAINLLVNNIPGGNEFINHDMDKCSVQGVFNENDTIERIKNEKAKINKYIVNNIGFDSVNKTIPKEVKEITKFTDLNLRGQFDGFFLLQNNPGEVARKLNEIVNLQIMDDCIKKAKSKVTNQNQENKHLEKELALLKSKLIDYKWVDEADELLKEIEELNNKADIIINCIVDLKSHLSNLEYYDDKLKIVNEKLKAKNLYNSIIKDFDNYSSKKARYDILMNLIFEHDKYNYQLKKYEDLNKRKKDLKNINILYGNFVEKNKNNEVLQSYYNELSICDMTLKKYKNLKNRRVLLTNLNKKIKEYEKKEKLCFLLHSLLNISTNIIAITVSLKDLKKKKEELLPEGSICPLCKTKIKGNK